MTYSRPGTRTVNALANVPTPMQVGVKGSSSVEVSRSGRILDNRSPGQILKNSEASTQAITSFLNTVTKTGAQVYKGVLVEEGRRQAGELLATQDPVELMRTGDEEQRNLVRSLNPFARDIVNQAAAEGAAARYQEFYAANLVKQNPILTDPNASDEARAQARAAAKNDAIQRSGVQAIDPAYMAQIAPQMARVEAAFDGKAYSGRLERQKQDDRSATVNEWASMLSKANQARQGNEFTPADAASLKQWWESNIKRQSAAWMPNETAGMVYDAVAQRAFELERAGEEIRAKELTDMMLSMARLGVKTPSGADFFDTPLPSGKSLGMALNQLSEGIDAKAKQAELRNARESVRGLMERLIRGEATEDEVRAAASTLPTEAMLPIVNDLMSASNIGQRPTEAQILAATELQYEAAAPGASRERSAQMWREAYNAGQITTKQFAAGMAQVRDGSSETVSTISQARNYLDGEFAAAAVDLTKARYGDAPVPKEAAEASQRELLIEVTRNVEKKAQAPTEAGKPWTRDQYVEEMRQELEAVRNQKRKEITDGKDSAPKTPVQKVMDEANYFGQKVRESGGNVSLSSFSPATITAAKSYYKKEQITAKEAMRYLSQRINAATENGKPAFSRSGEEELKFLIKKAKEGEKSSNANAIDYQGMIKGAATSLPGVNVLNQLNNLAQPLIKKVTGSDKPDAKGNQSSATRQPQARQLAEAVVSNGLRALAGVVERPAAAGTLDSEVLNMSALPALSGVYKRQKPITINTQPLPQLAAASQTTSIPLSINNDKHPYFIAIGIAEGTRTPNGGYTKAYFGHTDPGDGFANRGTVSGGRGMGNASPKQVDRIWMGKLTRQASSAAPILQRYGLRPGTQGWHRAMFNVLDLAVQAPAAVPDFVRKLSGAIRQGLTIESIAKARADSFINPATGRLEAGGFGNSYSRLLSDQRSRAGAYDYRRRL
jgi:hypothetical protein